MSSIPSRWVVTEIPISTAADVFPALPGQGFYKKTPTWNTTVQNVASGREVRISNWSGPKWAFDLSYEAIRNRVTMPELTLLWGFFATARGRYGAWFFQDPFDNLVSGGALGTGDGTTTQFQATRTLAAGSGYAFNEPVYAFYLQPTVYINGVSTTAFTVSPWGVIQFSTAPTAGQVLTWSGGFLYVCRFDIDTMDTTQITHDLFSTTGLKFVSLKP